MEKSKRIVSGHMIGLKQEFEEPYSSLHKHASPEVLQRIRQSNIIDFSIFLNHISLFSHMVYVGNDFLGDMKALSSDKSTREWWTLAEPMHNPFEFRKENGCWSEVELWYTLEMSKASSTNYFRSAYRVAVPSDMPESVPAEIFGDIDFWGTTYNLNSFKIFKGKTNLFIYLETYELTDLNPFMDIVTRVLKTDASLNEMKEIFHMPSI